MKRAGSFSTAGDTGVLFLTEVLADPMEGRSDGMTNVARVVLAEALRLAFDAGAEIAAELLGSLHGPSDPDAETAWNVEIERRVAAIEAGRVRVESWDDVRRRIEREALGRSRSASSHGRASSPGRAGRKSGEMEQTTVDSLAQEVGAQGLGGPTLERYGVRRHHWRHEVAAASGTSFSIRGPFSRLTVSMS